MVDVGQYNRLKVLRLVDFGAYLDNGADGILLPKRFAPANLNRVMSWKFLFTMTVTTGLLQPRKNPSAF
jgi:hypothetical protein